MRRTIALFVVGAIALSSCATAPEETPRTASEAPPPSRPPNAPPSNGGSTTPPSASATRLCPIAVANAPAADSQGLVAPAGARVMLDGESLRLAPATKSCLSSGFGMRSGKLHKGVDYFTDSDGEVIAAGDGVVRVATIRDDLGNMVVIDHGAGVFTLYGHLASIASGVVAGAKVKDGETLGPIGETGAASARHLHYEILTGTYADPAGVFGLSPVDPFKLPRAPTGA